jgi:hypothetical protein
VSNPYETIGADWLRLERDAFGIAMSMQTSNAVRKLSISISVYVSRGAKSMLWLERGQGSAIAKKRRLADAGASLGATGG